MERGAELIEALDLRPHPEGGYYKEIFRSTQRVRRQDTERAALTTIFYLLQAGDVSRWHVVKSDEVWNFHEGDALDLMTYDPATQKKTVVALCAASPVQVVEAGFWQAATPRGEYCLTGCTVAPGFEFQDFQLIREMPGHEAAFSGALHGTEDLL